MKKQALLATISLALVALAGCGDTGSSNTTSSGSISDTGSVGSTSNSSDPELTLQEQWEAIEMFEGTNKDLFFAKTATITPKSREAKTRTVLSEDLSGEMGAAFGMEYDWGYLNQTYEAVCSIYDNEFRKCDSVETTDRTAKDGANVVTEVISQTSHAYIETDESTSARTYYVVVDDGTGTHKVPNNYYSSKELSTGETFATVASFTMSTTSGAGSFLSLSYYNANITDTTIKYYVSEEEGKTAYNFWSFEDLTSQGYSGHSFSIKIWALFDDSNLLQIGVEQGYYYYGASVFIMNQYLDYGYESNGSYNETKFDHNLYKKYGTLVAEVEDGELDAEVDQHIAALLNAFTGQEEALEYGLPTYSEEQNYMFDAITYSQYNLEYEELEEIVTTVYSDGYVVKDKTVQYTDLLNGGKTTQEVATYQLSSDETNLYEIHENYDGTQDKVTTPISDEATYESFSNISEQMAILTLVELLSDEALEKDYTAYLLEGGEIEVYLQAVEQQDEDALTIGYEYNVDIVFEYVYDGDEKVGIRVLEALVVIDGQFDWESLYKIQYLASYSYDPAISTSDANYTPLNPANYDERVETEE